MVSHFRLLSICGKCSVLVAFAVKLVLITRIDFLLLNCKQPTHKWWDLNILHFATAVATKMSVLTAHNVLPGEGEPKKLSTFSMLSVGWIFTSCCSVACTTLKIAYPSISNIEVSKKMYFIFNSLMLMIIISPKHCQIRCELIFFACFNAHNIII